MTHQLIENYSDYFAVLARTETGDPKDERFVTRAFTTLGFDDKDSGDEGVKFVHDETRVTVTCDGVTVAIYPTDAVNDDAISGIYGDLFLAIQRLGWSSAILYCSEKNAEDVLHEMASHVPASFENFRITLGETGPNAEDVADIREAVAAHHDEVEEPSIVIRDLAPVSSSVETLRPLENLAEPSLMRQQTPERLASVPVAPAEPASGSKPALRVPAPAPIAERPKSEFQPVEAAFLERQLAAREREVAELHGMINQILSGRSMEQFAASVLPHDAIAIAHLYAASVFALDLLGFERVYNVYINEEYGVTFDGSFMVFTKDVAGPDWIDALIARMGGTVVRVWQAGKSQVGNLLDQHQQARFNTDGDHVDRTSPLNGQPAIDNQGEVSQAASEASLRGDLTPHQQGLLETISGTFSTVLVEVFKAQNATEKVANRVSHLELEGLSIATRDEARV